MSMTCMELERRTAKLKIGGTVGGGEKDFYFEKAMEEFGETAGRP